MSQVLEVLPDVMSDAQVPAAPARQGDSALGLWAAWLVVNGLVGAIALLGVTWASVSLFFFFVFSGFFGASGPTWGLSLPSFLVAALCATAVGLAAGIGQAWVLRRRLVSVKHWLGWTLAGWLLGILVGTVVTSMPVTAGTGPRESLAIEHAGWIIGGAVLYGAVVGTLVGLFQTTVLPVTRGRRGWWVVVSGLGSVVAFGVGMALVALTSASQLGEPSPMAVLGGLVGGLVYGLITGPVLVWLLRERLVAAPDGREVPDESAR